MGVTIVANENDCRVAIDNFKKHYEAFPVLGFGYGKEFVGERAYTYNLLQLAAIDGECILIKLMDLKHIPENLKSILENETILKVGVDPFRDEYRLRGDFGIRVCGTLDLRFLASKHHTRYPGEMHVLARNYVHVVLEKSWIDVLRKDPTCADPQVDYATRKTQVATSIFRKLASLLWPETNDWTMIYQHCTKLQCLDRQYLYKK